MIIIQTINGIPLTERNKAMRRHIGESLIKMMNEKSINEISVTSLVKEANTSRMTFYKYYTTKTDVLEDYMFVLVNEYVSEIENTIKLNSFNDFESIKYCFEFFGRQSDFARILIKNDMHSVIIKAVNSYMDSFILPNYGFSSYELYFYAGALFNIYIKWIENGMTESSEDMAKTVYGRLK